MSEIKTTEVGIIKYDDLAITYCIQTGPNWHCDYRQVDTEIVYEYEISSREEEFVETYIQLKENTRDVSDENFIIAQKYWDKYYEEIKELFRERVSTTASMEAEKGEL